MERLEKLVGWTLEHAWELLGLSAVCTLWTEAIRCFH